MAIDRPSLMRLGTLFVAGLLWGSAAAAAVPGLGIVDARHAAAQVVVSPPPTQPLLPFVRLSDPNARQVECCLRLQAGHVPARVMGPAGNRGAQALQAQPAQVLTAADHGPFVGLVLPPGSGARVLTRTAHTLALQWFVAGNNLPQRVQVRHCLSSEGLHVWWQPLPRAGARRSGWQHHYLPLNMDVEADCPSAWLPR